MTTHDPILKFVLRKENLSATLDILKRTDEIRRAALQTFWDELLSHLKTTTPRQLSNMKNMRWQFWSSGNGCEAPYYNLYFADASLDDAKQNLCFLVRHHKTPSTFEFDYGIQWGKEERVKSPLQRLPAVDRVRKALNADVFKSEGSWWFAKAELYKEESVEDFLIKYAKDGGQIRKKTSQAVWGLIKESIHLVVEANRAIQRGQKR